MKFIRKPKTLNQFGVHHILVPLLAFVLLFGIAGTYWYVASKAATIPELVSGMDMSTNGGPYCLDDYQNSGAANAEVDAWPCNGSDAQYYRYDTSNSEIIVGTGCIHTLNASATTGFTQTTVVMASESSCAQAAPWGGAWTMMGNSAQGFIFENNHADSSAANIKAGITYCLDIKGAQPKAVLDIYKCNGNPNQRWFPETYSTSTTSAPTAPSPISAAATGQIVASVGDDDQCLTQTLGSTLITLQPCSSSAPDQQWRESGNINGTAAGSTQVFQNVFSNQFLSAASLASGANVTVSSSEQGNVFWTIENDGTLLAGTNSSDACLADHTAASGKELTLSSCSGAMAWQLPTTTSSAPVDASNPPAPAPAPSPVSGSPVTPLPVSASAQQVITTLIDKMESVDPTFPCSSLGNPTFVAQCDTALHE